MADRSKERFASFVADEEKRCAGRAADTAGSYAGVEPAEAT